MLHICWYAMESTQICVSPGKWRILEANSSAWQWQSDRFRFLYTLCSTCNHHYWLHVHILWKDLMIPSPYHHLIFYHSGNGTQPWNTVCLLGTTIPTRSVSHRKLFVIQLKFHLFTSCILNPVSVQFFEHTGIYILQIQ